MDLDLRGRKAILSAASKGLGKACAMSLAREGVDVTIMARTAADIEETAAEIARETGVTATPVPGDFNTKEGREALLAACPNPDIVVNNPGVRQVPGNFREWDESVWLQWLNDHFLSSVQFIQSVTPGMCERKFGRVVNMSVSFIKFPQVGICPFSFGPTRAFGGGGINGSRAHPSQCYN